MPVTATAQKQKQYVEMGAEPAVACRRLQRSAAVITQNPVSDSQGIESSGRRVLMKLDGFFR